MKLSTSAIVPAALIVAVFAATSAGAQTVFNAATAQDFQNDLTTASANGAATNIIYLANGYYTGNFNYNSASGDNSCLIITPALALSSTNITIDGAGLGRDVNITCGGSSGYVNINGITFLRNCGNSTFGAVRIAAATGGNIIVSDCQFLSATNMEGIGIEIAAGQNLTITNCTVQGFSNQGGSSDANGSGIYVSGITGNTFICDDTLSGNYQGYGVYISSGAVLTFTNNVVGGNSSQGVVFTPGGSPQVLISGNVFNGNHSDGIDVNAYNTLNFSGNICSGNSGEGISASGGGGTAIVTENTFVGNGSVGANLSCYVANVISNSFQGNYCYENAGGLISSANTNIIVGNVFQGNVGGGPYNDTGGGADVYSAYLLVVTNDTFNANQSQTGEGGGLYMGVNNNTVATLAGNSFIGNSSIYGGALFIQGNGNTNFISGNTFEQNSANSGGGAIYGEVSTIVISDNLIANNTEAAANANGGGIFLNPSSAAYVVNNTIFGNSAGGAGGGIAFQTAGTQSLYAFNNIIWGNSAVGSGADIYLAGGGSQTELLYNDVNGLYGVWDIAEDLQNIDPKFFNPVGGDYHFPGTSPCANAGTNGAPAQPLTDLDGNLRTNILGQIDLGCYEFNTNAPHPADTNGLFVVTSGEFNSYANAWKNGLGWTNWTSGPNPVPIPANYLTRAGYLMTNGGAYTNDGSARPTNWKPSAP